MKWRRKSLKIMIPFTSMGDIAFLLIIFFMLTSNFMQQETIVLDKPQGPDVEDVERAPVLVAMDREGRILLQGQEVASSALRGALSALRETQGDRAVHVSIDKHVPRLKFMPVMQALSQESPGTLVFLGEPEAPQGGVVR